MLEIIFVVRCLGFDMEKKWKGGQRKLPIGGSMCSRTAERVPMKLIQERASLGLSRPWV